jgi:hypothetical protein
MWHTLTTNILTYVILYPKKQQNEVRVTTWKSKTLHGKHTDALETPDVNKTALNSC